jgi:hypothetical protein
LPLCCIASNVAIWQTGNESPLFQLKGTPRMTSKRPSLADTMRQVITPEPAAAPPPAAPAAPATPKTVPDAARPAGFYAATRAGKKKVTAALDPAMHRDLKMLAAEKGATAEALILEALTDLFRKHGKGNSGRA